MNQRQELFCKWYISTQNATKSAIEAGYSSKSAYSAGHRLLKNVEIQKFIKAEMAKSEENIPDDAEIKLFWAETMRDCKQKMSIRMAASNNLAKARGMYRDEW